MNNATNILLSRNESAAIKGLLILLIVIGHNDIVASLWNKSIYSYLYTFHVYSFFILPFLYPVKRLTRTRFWDNFVRYYVPYTWAFALCLTINYFIIHQQINGFETLRAYIVGYIGLLRETTGFSFLWFMPTAFALFVLREIYNHSGTVVRAVLIVLSLAVLSISIFSSGSIYILASYTPLGLTQALQFLFMAIVAKYIIEGVSKSGDSHQSMMWYKIISSTLFISLSIAYIYLRLSPYSADFAVIKPYFYTIMPILAISTMVAFRTVIGKSRFLANLGSLSYPIYLFHVFIYNTLIVIAEKSNLPLNPYIGVVILILTLSISVLIARLLQKIDVVNRVLIPNSVAGLCGRGNSKDESLIS